MLHKLSRIVMPLSMIFSRRSQMLFSSSSTPPALLLLENDIANGVSSKTICEDLKNVANYQQSSPATRRLLGNIPAFNDHSTVPAFLLSERLTSLLIFHKYRQCCKYYKIFSWNAGIENRASGQNKSSLTWSLASLSARYLSPRFSK